MIIMDINGITIYPFSRDQLQLINILMHRNKKIHIELVAPTGFGYVEKDAGAVDGRSKLGLTVGNDIDKALEATDTFWAADGEYSDVIRQKAFHFANIAIERGKNFICDLNLSEEEKSYYTDKCKQNNVCFIYCDNEYSEINRSLLYKRQEFYVPSIPIVFVAGLIPKLNEVDTVFYLVESLEKKGCKVASITENPADIIIGSYPLPKAFFHSELDGVEKIYYINSFIKYVIEQDRPDILIIQVPGGFMKYSNEYQNDFGLYTFMLSHAVRPDYSILCMPLDRVDDRYYDLLISAAQVKYDIRIDFILISNLLIDLGESREEKKLSHVYCSLNFLKSIVSNSISVSENIDSYLLESGKEKLLNHIFTALQLE